MNKRHYEHTLPNIRGSLSNTYIWNFSYFSPALQVETPFLFIFVAITYDFIVCEY